MNWLIVGLIGYVIGALDSSPSTAIATKCAVEGCEKEGNRWNSNYNSDPFDTTYLCDTHGASYGLMRKLG